MKFIILQIFVFATIASFAGSGQALTSQECSQAGLQCLCIAFPGSGGPACTPLQNVADKAGYVLKE